jgi:hypothetical protein
MNSGGRPYFVKINESKPGEPAQGSEIKKCENRPILARLLHCGNQRELEHASGTRRPPKKLASAWNLRFNLNKVAYMLVAAPKTGDKGQNV